LSSGGWANEAIVFEGNATGYFGKNKLDKGYFFDMAIWRTNMFGMMGDIFTAVDEAIPIPREASRLIFGILICVCLKK
jgi:hypothetical protein